SSPPSYLFSYYGTPPALPSLPTRRSSDLEPMPEMPEVQGLVEFLRGRVVGLTITRTSVANIAALKTYDPPIDALKGAEITGADRHGKFVDLSTTAGHLVFHLAKAGWLRWYDQLPTTIIKPGRTPIA